MLRRVLPLAVVALSACYGPVDELVAIRAPLDGGADAGEEVPVDCALDADCPRGMVCAADSAGVHACVPGCRENAQCAKNFVCQLGVTCTGGACPPGWCQPDPCRDLDHDGYAATIDPNAHCPGKQVGDCNDADPRVHPNAKEWCANWVDDDCDGLRDGADPSCKTCDPGAGRCNTSYECGFGSRFCNEGCCEACPKVDVPQCQPGECVQPTGVDPETGCARPATCGACATCPQTVSPVCGLDGATYSNQCLAQARGVEVLHTGACVSGENLDCAPDSTAGYWWGGCPWGLYCRDAAPGQTPRVLRCTQRYACVRDEDCPEAIGASVTCGDGGVAELRCMDHVCRTKC